MSEKRMDLPCPKCGASSFAAMTTRDEHGQPIRARICDNRHRFVVVGGPEIRKKGPKPKKTYPGPVLTEWRPLPAWESRQ